MLPFRGCNSDEVSVELHEFLHFYVESFYITRVAFTLFFCNKKRIKTIERFHLLKAPLGEGVNILGKKETR